MKKGDTTHTLQGSEPVLICTSGADGTFCIKRGEAAIQVENQQEVLFLLDNLKTAKKHLP
jgi:hypothetical protein